MFGSSSTTRIRVGMRGAPSRIDSGCGNGFAGITWREESSTFHAIGPAWGTRSDSLSKLGVIPRAAGLQLVARVGTTRFSRNVLASADRAAIRGKPDRSYQAA